jgi:drug/metabolite transporter (DMT)-like permease
MLIQIAVFAWAFLDEQLTLREIGGLLLVAIGILLVQVRSSVLDNNFIHTRKKQSDESR